MNLKESLELIQKTAVAASAAKVTAIPGDPRQVIVDTNGESKTFPVPAPVRGHEIHSLQDFIEAAQHWGTKGIVFHCHESIVLVVDDEDRRDVVTMELHESATFEFLRTVGDTRMDHRTMIDVLRNQLYGHVIETLLPAVRKIEIANSGKSASEINPGRERGTREFMHALADAESIPEYVDVTTSVYSDMGLRAARMIRCSFEVQLPQMVFALKPLPDELDIAIQDAQMDLHEQLRKELEIPVYHGKP